MTTDEFAGDTPHLIRCIEALLSLDAKGAIVPHGIGGHARTLLSAAASRLAADESTRAPDAPVAWQFRFVFADGRRGAWSSCLDQPRGMRTGDSGSRGSTFEVRDLFAGPVCAPPSGERPSAPAPAAFPKDSEFKKHTPTNEWPGRSR